MVDKKKQTVLDDRKFMATVMQHAQKSDDMFNYIKEVIENK